MKKALTSILASIIALSGCAAKTAYLPIKKKDFLGYHSKSSSPIYGKDFKDTGYTISLNDKKGISKNYSKDIGKKVLYASALEMRLYFLGYIGERKNKSFVKLLKEIDLNGNKDINSKEMLKFMKVLGYRRVRYSVSDNGGFPYHHYNDIKVK